MPRAPETSSQSANDQESVTSAAAFVSRPKDPLDSCGRLWHGRYPAPTLRAVSFEADQAAQVLPDPGVAIVPIVAVHGAQVPCGKVVMDGVPMVPARRLPSMLRELPAVLSPERVAELADRPGPLPRCRLTSTHAGSSRGTRIAVRHPVGIHAPLKQGALTDTSMGGYWRASNYR
jgi:hypothetical protein